MSGNASLTHPLSVYLCVQAFRALITLLTISEGKVLRQLNTCTQIKYIWLI